MRFSDTLAGLVIAGFGAAVLTHASAFPPMPGQPVGPGLFPMVVASALIVLGLVLAATGRRAGTQAWLVVEEWVRTPRLAFNFLLVIIVLLFYSVSVNALGFFITSFVSLSVLFLAFGVRRRWIAPVAAAVTAFIHYGFYTLLRVPLPWGLLEAIAW